MDKVTPSGQPLIQVSYFEGPLDLLLHLIKTNEMDIYDIRIATITSQYLTYLHQMQVLRLDIAGEYFVMAANLMAIKAKLLLPKPTLVADDDVAPEDDPREDLVQRLLDYQRYKQAAQELKVRAQQRQQHFTRPAMAVPDDVVLTVEPGIQAADLQTALARLIKRARIARPVTQSIQQEQYTIKEQMQVVLTRLERAEGPMDFERLVGQTTVVDEIVTTFLAILELARQRQVALSQASRLLPLQVNFLKAKGSYATDVTSGTN